MGGEPRKRAQVTIPYLLAQLGWCIPRKKFEELALESGLSRATLKRLKYYVRKLGYVIKYHRDEEWICPPGALSVAMIPAPWEPRRTPLTLVGQAFAEVSRDYEECRPDPVAVESKGNKLAVCFYCFDGHKKRWVIACVEK